MLGDARRVGFEARGSPTRTGRSSTGPRVREHDELVADDQPRPRMCVRSRRRTRSTLIRAGAEINDRIYEWLASEGLDGRPNVTG